jgi:hypothetical protein
LYFYLCYTLEKQKVKQNRQFVFDQSIMDAYISEELKEMLWLDTYRTNTLLTGVWYFSEFMVITGNSNEADKNTVKDSSQKLHALEQESNKGYVESYLFAQFPMW